MEEIDLLKGIGIFLMVFNHVGFGSKVHMYVQSFHMPLFFIASGFLWNDRPLGKVIKKKARSLLVPYFFFSFAYLLMEFCVKQMDWADVSNSLKAVFLYPTDKDNIPIASALWFLPCLFEVEILYSLVSSKFKLRSKSVLAVIVAVIGFLYSKMGTAMLPCALQPITMAYPFMVLGELLKKYYVEITRILDKKSCFWGCFVAFMAIATLNGSVDLRSGRFGEYIFAFVLTGMLGTGSVLGIANHLKNSKLAIVRGLQQFSIDGIVYLCTNQFFISIFKKVLTRVIPASTGIGQLSMRMLVVVCTLIACYAMAYLINHSPLRRALGR
jgi:fucose 4-O-acetylase-like acetyltransferase